MGRKKKHRMEVGTAAAQPDDGDHYAIKIRPPLTDDGAFCDVKVAGRTWGQGGRAEPSQQAAIDYIRSKIAEWETKANDDVYRGSLPRYPEPPKPANTRFIVHPDYEGQISPREIWGDTTLGAFGVDTTAKFDETPWFEAQSAYDEWIAPIREAGDGATALRVYTKAHANMAYFWVLAFDEDRPPHIVRYVPHADTIRRAPKSWTQVTRMAGGIGLTHPDPADIRHVPVEESPFAAGIATAEIESWIEAAEIEAMEPTEGHPDESEKPAAATA